MSIYRPMPREQRVRLFASHADPPPKLYRAVATNQNAARLATAREGEQRTKARADPRVTVRSRLDDPAREGLKLGRLADDTLQAMQLAASVRS